MRNVFGFLLMLLFAAMVMAQILPSWGYPVRLGTKFKNTDSLSLRDDYVADTLKGSTTVYSDVILFPGDKAEGIEVVSLSLKNIGTATTASVYIRLYYGKHLSGYFGPWKAITTSLSETYEPVTFNLADSSWWQAAAGRQFKVVNNTANDAFVRIIEFPR